jgi:Bacterial PH domain
VIVEYELRMPKLGFAPTTLSHVEGTGPVVSQPLSVRLTASIGGAFLTLMATVIAGVAVGSAPGGAIILGGSLLGVAAFLRGFRISLVADHDGLTVRNYIRTYHVSWLKIDEIGIGVLSMGGVLLDSVTIQLRGSALVVPVQATVFSERERRRVTEELARLRPDVRLSVK